METTVQGKIQPSASTSAAQDNTNKSKKRFILPKHTLLIAIASLIFLGMAGGIFVMQKNSSRKVKSILMRVPFQKEEPKNPINPTIIPTTDPTLNWQTYSNKSLSIKYPARFTITEYDLPYTAVYPKIYSSTLFTDGMSTVAITAAKNSSNYSLSTLSGNGPYLRYSSDIITDGSTALTKIAGMDAQVTTRIPAGKTGTAMDVLLISNSKIYQFTLSPIDADTTTFTIMLNTLLLHDLEPSDITDGWQVYTNSFYGYSLKYPLTYGIDHEKKATVSALAVIFDTGNTSVDNPKFRLEVQDIKNIGQSNTTSRNLLGLPLDQYVNKKWDYNKASDSAIPNKTVSAIKELTVAGKIAFEFSVTGGYRDDLGSEKLTTEYRYIFSESNGYKYKIWFPKSDSTFLQAFKTITFTK